jgi:proteasome lid subunit RPN8/RPN11
VELDAELAPLEMPRDVFHELCEHARNAHPEECCGLIFGTPDRRFARVVRCRNEMNQRHAEDSERYPRDNRTGFWMSQIDYGKALEKYELFGERVTAVYHSHVDCGVYLSEHDLDYAEPGVFPDADQIVISVRSETVGGREEGRFEDAGIFRRERVGSPLIGRRLVAGTP